MRLGPLRIGLAAKAVVLVFVLPVAMLLFVVSTGLQPLGLGGYLLLTAMVGVWNAAALVHLVRGEEVRWWGGLLAAGMMVTLLCWTLFHPALFKYPRAVLLATCLVAFVETLVCGVRARERRLRHYAAPIYNLAIACNMLVWTMLDAGASPPAFLSAFGYASGLTQAVNFFWLAVFMPMLFLPPVLLRIDHDERIVLSPRGKVNMKTVLWGVGKSTSVATAYLLGFFVLSAVVGAGNISSFGKADDAIIVRNGMQFAIVARSFTAEPKPYADWSGEVAHEIGVARDLRLNYLRYDVRSEMIEGKDGMAALANVSARLHGAGLKVMFGLYGRNSWPNPPPSSFDVFEKQIINDTLAVANMADYVLPFYEPNGQAQINYGRYATPETWARAVREVTVAVHGNSSARVLVEVGDNADARKLIPSLCAQGIDAIGFDIYPGNKADLRHIEDYDALVNRSNGIEVWVSEFGMECSMYGEGAQANAVTDVVAFASRLNCSGCCLWCLEDDTGLGHLPMTASRLGIVRSDWTAKPAYEAYKTAIQDVRG